MCLVCLLTPQIGNLGNERCTKIDSKLLGTAGEVAAAEQEMLHLLHVLRDYGGSSDVGLPSSVYRTAETAELCATDATKAYQQARIANRGAQREKRSVRDAHVRVWHQLVSIAKRAGEAEILTRQAEKEQERGDLRRFRKRAAKAVRRAARAEKEASVADAVLAETMEVSVSITHWTSPSCATSMAAHR